jgi:hypothetical protein
VTHPSAIPMLVRFFRSAASVDIDKSDVRRFREFVDEQIDGLAIAGRNSAKRNGRDVISLQDLPITKGVQERMREFDKLEEAERIRELLRQQVRRPPAEVTACEGTPISAATPRSPPVSQKVNSIPARRTRPTTVSPRLGGDDGG